LATAEANRHAVVTSVDGSDDVDFPIAVDTKEVMPKAMMLKRLKERSGKPVAGLWRKLRSFELVPGTFEAPSRASALNKALTGAVAAAVEADREAVQDAGDEIVPETPQSSVCSSTESGVDFDDVPAPSAPGSVISASAASGGAPPTYSPGDAREGRFAGSTGCCSPVQESEKDDVPATSASGSAIISPADSGEGGGTSKATTAREESRMRSTVVEIVNLVSFQEDQQVQEIVGGDQPSSVDDQKAAAYLRAIPNRLARANIRHQPKKKRV
jgi:hypothetical protein